MTSSAKEEPPIVVEVDISAPADRVWRAITDKAEMPRWFFENIADFRAERGFETTFLVHNEGRTYPHHWKVTEVVPNQKIVYDWLYDGVPGASFVTWDLTKTNDGTRLVLTHTGGYTFPQDDPAFRRDSCQGGWEYFLGRLKRFVETGTA
jgi:uncharacterized protein YndB with AHSA1/START domain